jgi:hypothetical protein
VPPGLRFVLQAAAPGGCVPKARGHGGQAVEDQSGLRDLGVGHVEVGIPVAGACDSSQRPMLVVPSSRALSMDSALGWTSVQARSAFAR